jgi:hypothetical protein
VVKELRPELQQNSKMIERLSASIDMLSEKIAGMNSAPRAVVGGVPVPAAAWPRYPVRPRESWWTGCGGWHHLTQGDHAGLFDRGWLQSLSNAEIQSLHSDHHENRVKWDHVIGPRNAIPIAGAAGAAVRYPPPSIAVNRFDDEFVSRRGRRHRRSACPGGICPRG